MKTTNTIPAAIKKKSKQVINHLIYCIENKNYFTIIQKTLLVKQLMTANDLPATKNQMKYKIIQT